MIVAVAIAIPLLLVICWPSAGKARWGAVVLLLGICLFSLAHQAMYDTLAEDAFITLRYSHNQALGYGPVFNVGERVEGYSNFLMMEMLALAEGLLGWELVITARLIGVVASVLTILMTYRVCQQLPDGTPALGLTAGIIVAASGPFAVYGPSGLETSLSALLMISAVSALLARRWILAGLLVGFTTLSHLDGVLLLLPACAWALYVGTTRSERWLSAFKVAAGAAAVGLPWTIWRVAYYGHFLPNSVVAKSGIPLSYRLHDGLRYLAKGCYLHLPLMVLFVLILAALFLRGKRTPGRWFDAIDALLAGIVVMYSAYVTWIGGDWMPAVRFLVPLVPLAAILVARIACRAFAEFPFRLTSRAGAGLLAALLLVSFAFSKVDKKLYYDVDHWHQQVDSLGELGRWLHKSLPPDTLVAAYANGALSYYSQLPTIDLMGLTDEHIALEGKRNPVAGAGHPAYDDDYVVSRHPSVVVFTSAGLEAQASGWVLVDSLTGDDLPLPHNYMRDYVPVSIYLPDSHSSIGHYANLLILRSDSERLIKLLSAGIDHPQIVVHEQREKPRS